MSGSQYPGRGDQRQIVYNPDLQLYLFWDAQCGQYYYYDHQQDQLVYSDRSRVARPQQSPRSFYQNPYGLSQQQSAATLPEADLNTSPGGETSRYTSQRAAGASPPLRSLQSNVRGPEGRVRHNDLSQAYGNLPVQVSPSAGSSTTPQASAYFPTPVRPQVFVERGLRTVYAADEQTRVRTVFATGPKERISDTTLLRHGAPAHRMLLGTEGDAESLFPGYSVKRPGNKWFRLGRVFLVLWVEPAGEAGTVIDETEGPSDPAIS